MFYYHKYDLPNVKIDHMALVEIVDAILECNTSERFNKPTLKIRVRVDGNSLKFDNLDSYFEFACSHKAWLSPDELSIVCLADKPKGYDQQEIELEIGRRDTKLSMAMKDKNQLYKSVDIIEGLITKFKMIAIKPEYCMIMGFVVGLISSVLMRFLTSSTFWFPISLITFAGCLFVGLIASNFSQPRSKIKL